MELHRIEMYLLAGLKIQDGEEMGINCYGSFCIEAK